MIPKRVHAAPAAVQPRTFAVETQATPQSQVNELRREGRRSVCGNGGQPSAGTARVLGSAATSPPLETKRDVREQRDAASL